MDDSHTLGMTSIIKWGPLKVVRLNFYSTKDQAYQRSGIFLNYQAYGGKIPILPLPDKPESSQEFFIFQNPNKPLFKTW